MPPDTLKVIARRTPLVTVVFSALSAVGGGIALVATGGLGVPLSVLKGSPFSSFVLPAIILVVVIGGTHALASVLLLRHRPASLLSSAVAGFAMIVWILVETVIIGGFSWLQGIYFAVGIVEVALVLALLGVMPWFAPRAARLEVDESSSSARSWCSGQPQSFWRWVSPRAPGQWAPPGGVIAGVISAMAYPIVVRTR